MRPWAHVCTVLRGHPVRSDRRARVGDRRHACLRRGRGRGARPARRDRLLPGRALQRDHGAVRLGQVDPDAHPRRPGPADHGHRRPRRHGADVPGRQGAHGTAPRPGRLRLPVLQPAARPRRAREHRAPAVDRRPQAGPGVAGPPDRRGGAARPADPSALRAVGWPAAARRHRPRAGHQACRGLRRRADRQPRLEVLDRGARTAAPLGRRVRPDGDHGHSRRARRLVRRPAAAARRRAHRPRRRRRDARGHPRPPQAGRLMGKVAFRGLFARKLRLALTALAIALGVTLISGTYVFTDTINASFDRIFQASNKGTDASITAREGVSTDQGTTPTLPQPLLAKVRAQLEVAQADGSVFDIATVFDAKGHKIGATGSPSFVGSVSQLARFRATTVKTGRFPRSSGEAVIDAGSAQREGIRVGDPIAVQAAARKTTFRVVGTVQVAGVDSFGGSTVVDLVLPEAQRVLGKVGRLDQIQTAGRPGVTPVELRAALRRALPPSVVVRTGQQQAAKESRDIRDQLGFLTTALLAFAGISLFVGAFIIFNTFSITVTQRIREFALLRTLGASRAQVLRSVLGEGLALGVLGSLVGLGLGVVTAVGLRALFKAVGVDLPSNGSVIETRTIVVSVLVGTVVTVASSIAPALRATRVAPVEALREGVQSGPETPSRRMAVIATLLTAVGVALMCYGLFGSFKSDTSALSLMGGGVAATFLGVALLSPYLVRPLASAIGRPIEALTGVTGRLARGNTTRQPGRTAVTAAALMIGVALVTFASIFAAGARDSIAKAVDDNLKAGLVVQSDNGFSAFSATALQEATGVPGVAGVS